MGDSIEAPLRFAGMVLRVATDIPENEIWIVRDGQVVAKIVNIAGTELQINPKV